MHETMSRIKELPKSSSHLLTCTQVITSVQSVVKELLENALDSQATNVEVKLENFGLEKIEVKDNGDGIMKDDIRFVAKPHCTSKITSHSDLDKVTTYGFRGEALAAICAVAGLAITTKTADEEFGYTHTFDHNGNILSSKPCPCNQGTSVVVTNLFSNVPVRKQLYRPEKKKKEELRLIEDILVAFGCILKNIRFVLYHNRNLIWQKSIVDRTIDGLHLALGDAADYMENCEYVDEETRIKIETFLPKCNVSPTCGQTSSNRSIVAINKRPVRMKSIDKLLKEYYSKSLGDGHKSRYPVCFVSIEVPTTDIDVNYEPNKTAVLLHNMDVINEQLSKLLSSFYDTDSNIGTTARSNNASNVISPVPSEYKTAKVSDIYASSNIVDKENGPPTFHLNRLQFADTLQINKPREDLISRKKLSRKSDVSTPSNKKIKFSTPPNDVYRHINTLEAFFSSENKSSEDASTKSNNSCVNELCIEKSGKNETPSGNSSTRNESIFSDQDSMIITVQRKDANVNDGDTLVLDSFDKTLSKNTTETSMENNNLFLGNSKSPNKCNGISKDSSSFASGSNQAQSPSLIKVNKAPFVSALSMMNKERNRDLHSVETNEKWTTLDERPQGMDGSKSNLSLNASDPLTACDWSRGLRPAENIQPVAVLKPKVVEMGASNGEARSNAEQIDIQEPCVGSMIQRKITPFDFFCRKHRLEVAALNPELNNQQLAQILSEKWNRLSSEEKAVYRNMVSKDYPKNIKIKEKLGKIVEESINKIKSSSSNSKKVVQKKRRKRVERKITFNVQFLQEYNLNSSSETESEDSFKVINCLAPGIWICSRGKELHLLNYYRLQEAVIYFRLLDTYRFEAEPMASSIILTSSTLGNDALDVLVKMEVVNEYGSEYVSDERLAANGFKMKILQGEDGIQVELVGMTKSMAFYGVPDLKEILGLVQEKGSNVKLSNCRPGKAILYLQGEAVRITRQSPASKKIEDIEHLLKQMDTLPSKTCLHSKPYLHELYTIQCL